MGTNRQGASNDRIGGPGIDAESPLTGKEPDLNSPSEPAWAEIDLGAVGRNIRELKRVTRPGAAFMAVVKADAYGHGAVDVARTALAHGADRLGVARIAEAVELRQAGLKVPILIFGHTPPERASELIRRNLTQTVYRRDTAEMLSEQAVAEGKRLPVHLKIDTGMGRLGMLSFSPEGNPAAVLESITSICKLPGLAVEGIFTHFAASDSVDKSYSRLQFERFMNLLDRLRSVGIEFQVRHCANSAGIIDLPETHLDLVRGGIAIYGLPPSDEVDLRRIALSPAMALKSRIIHLKSVPAGFKVSYGMTYETPAPTSVATVSIGYADGLNRLLSSRGHMLVRGRRAAIVGRVCMDLTMLDVGHIPEARVGDEVVIFGRQEKELIHVDEIAALLHTINYEVVSTITRRVPRIYSS